VKGQQDYDNAFAAMDDCAPTLILRQARCSCAIERRSRKFACRHIPSIAAFRENTEAGALISYGFDLIGLFRDIAVMSTKLHVAPNRPKCRSTSLRFHMAVNLKTAASLGISLSDSFVARANEVRE